MKKENNTSRRQFLLKTIAAGSLLGIGCPKLMASSGKSKNPPNEEVVQTFRFILSNHIAMYKGLEEELGSEKLVGMLKKISADFWAEGIKQMTKDIKEKNIENYAQLTASFLASAPYNIAMEYEITKQDEKTMEVKFTKCLFAEIYKEMDAADIGWVMQCTPGETAIKSYNPAMKVSVPKSLMKGDEYCIERIELTS